MLRGVADVNDEASTMDAAGSIAPKHRVGISRPLLGEAEAVAARRVILSGWVTQGPEVEAFEREFAAAVGAPHAVAVSSCTTALHASLLALEIGSGDEVITVSHSFIATANVVRYCSATPVFVDIALNTFNIDPSLVKAAITPRTRAILAVHQIGMPADLAALLKIARAAGLWLIEDCACAIGSEIEEGGHWEKLGKPHGDIACFSFHPRKLVTTGDGGMITMRDGALDRTLRLLRQHGMSVPDTARHASDTAIFESYDTVGYNYRLTDIQAAVGRAQLARLPEMVAERRRRAAFYLEALRDVPGLKLPEEPIGVRTNWQSFCVLLPPDRDQRAVMQALLDRGIASRRGIMCSHREPAYADLVLRFPLPRSEEAQDRGLLLPLYNGMQDGDQELVVEALIDTLR
jgi:perosamine synthetase